MTEEIYQRAIQNHKNSNGKFNERFIKDNTPEIELSVKLSRHTKFLFNDKAGARFFNIIHQLGEYDLTDTMYFIQLQSTLYENGKIEFENNGMNDKVSVRYCATLPASVIEKADLYIQYTEICLTEIEAAEKIQKKILQENSLKSNYNNRSAITTN